MNCSRWPRFLTVDGVILDIALASANAADLMVGAELSAEQADLDVTGDKGYRSEPIASALHEDRGITLQTLPRSFEIKQIPAATHYLLNHVHQILDTVNGQLTDQFHLELIHALTFEGLCKRLLTM